MGYKGLIIKIQKLQANYNRKIADMKKEVSYVPFCSKEAKIELYEKFADELENILKSEQYGMKKHFKY